MKAVYKDKFEKHCSSGLTCDKSLNNLIQYMLGTSGECDFMELSYQVGIFNDNQYYRAYRDNFMVNVAFMIHLINYSFFITAHFNHELYGDDGLEMM